MDLGEYVAVNMSLRMAAGYESGRSSAGLASPCWSCSYDDALGRTVCETRPGFRGALLITSNEYNTANQLVATRTYSQPSRLTRDPGEYKGTPTWHISLGGNASGAFSGRLELIPSLLFNPNLRRLDSSILKLTGSAKSGLDIVNFTSTRRIEELRWEGGRQRRYIRIERLVDRRRFVGIKSKDGYAAFSSPTNFPFSVSFYRNADIGDEYDLEGNYLLVTNSLPYAVYEIGYGDTNLHAQAYSLWAFEGQTPVNMSQ